ncbi:MAG TPA: sugar transferase [Bacillota bacterium]|nr:sugar transferase [Bacillota bacterium]
MNSGGRIILRLQFIIKRIFDIGFSLFLLLLMSPVFLVVGIIIKLDSKGPILFKQDRLGRNGQVFKINKYRTMIVNAEKTGTGVFTSEQDPRITKVGRFLRKTSLDELPQILNILKGEMSFIGPRPPVPYHPYVFAGYSERQKVRFSVLPGVTGLAQVKGRNSLSWDERIEFDIQYVNQFSLLLDLKILFLTAFKISARENIYRSKKSSE